MPRGYVGTVEILTRAPGFYLFRRTVRYLLYNAKTDYTTWYTLHRGQRLNLSWGIFQFDGWGDAGSAYITQEDRESNDVRAIKLRPGEVTTVAKDVYRNTERHWDIHNGIPRNKKFTPVILDSLDDAWILFEGIWILYEHTWTALSKDDYMQLRLFEKTLDTMLDTTFRPKRTAVGISLWTIVQGMTQIADQHRDHFIHQLLQLQPAQPEKQGSD